MKLSLSKTDHLKDASHSYQETSMGSGQNTFFTFPVGRMGRGPRPAQGEKVKEGPGGLTRAHNPSQGPKSSPHPGKVSVLFFF